MKFPLTLVRARSSRHMDDIEYLQRLTLPWDQPCSTEIGTWWVVYEESTPAAFAGVRQSQQWIDCVYLCRAGVAPAYRGFGLQRKLIYLRERHARAQGKAWAVTDTTDNPASSNSLIHCGYRLFEPSRPWAGKRSLYWRKRI